MEYWQVERYKHLLSLQQVKVICNSIGESLCKEAVAQIRLYVPAVKRTRPSGVRARSARRQHHDVLQVFHVRPRAKIFAFTGRYHSVQG